MFALTLNTADELLIMENFCKHKIAYVFFNCDAELSPNYLSCEENF